MPGLLRASSGFARGELSITEAKGLTASTLLDRTDPWTETLAATIQNLQARWTEPGTLPHNLQGLASNIIDLAKTLRITLQEIWTTLDTATGSGRGAKLLDVSPYAAILDALVAERKALLFAPLAHEKNNRYLFVPNEIELPALSNKARNWIVRPSP